MDHNKWAAYIRGEMYKHVRVLPDWADGFIYDLAQGLKWMVVSPDRAKELKVWDQMHAAIAHMLGEDPETWPDHGNKPLAISATFALLCLRRVDIGKMERDCLNTFFGGYHDDEEKVAVFQHGMKTAFRVMREEYDRERRHP